jgi:hypothetical protein
MPYPVTRTQLNKYSLKGSVSQKWLRAVNLPLIIGSTVDKKIISGSFLYLLRIFRLVFSETETNFEIIMLGSHISDFLKCYLKYFNSKFTFKMHNLVHYPELVQEFGPFRTMRYEANHPQMKGIQRRTRNFTNVPYTLSYRHQQWEAKIFMQVKYSGNGRIFTRQINISKETKVIFFLLQDGGQIVGSMGYD